jgi:uncharacterized membrane protein YadS
MVILAGRIDMPASVGDCSSAGAFARIRGWPGWSGTILCVVLGGVALVLVRSLPTRTFMPDILIALALGALIVNTPLRRVLGSASAAELRDTSRFTPGLKFVGRTVLRFAVVLMGLRIQARFFGVSEAVVMFCAIAAAMPTAFFLIHAVAVPLRVPRALADLIAAGTMICGASAVNAMAPVVGADKQEQGIALGTVFLFSVAALVAFHPIAAWLGVPALDAGLWSGLAVNDLSSAVAVGAQMGPGGAEMAAASKSARVVLLAPLLIAFAFLRSSRGATSEVRRHALQQLPGFVAGFVVLAVARAAGDHFFAGAALWTGILVADRLLVDVAMMTVAAGIGLHLGVRGLVSAGARALMLGAVGATAMAALTLGLVVLGKQGGPFLEMLFGALTVTVAYFAFRTATAVSPGPVTLPLQPAAQQIDRR